MGTTRKRTASPLSFFRRCWKTFARDETIREKYNVVTRSSETNVKAGYAANVIGFGWTNAVFVELLHSLPPEKIKQLSQAVSSAAASN